MQRTQFINKNLCINNKDYKNQHTNNNFTNMDQSLLNIKSSTLRNLKKIIIVFLLHQLL
ncbi:uncharacterized protein PGTG_10446 [Puccinia graminis f. sp. tritici CRL 75-36-700-3]|uniref:Uncharacterized protein n=1 Tax=Puccinia graminis f. sp. tritici (strain CRL 75-36-700-3 / race SCCL) TaxID=418459 RepID=E3KIE3_PUCGT|nr:uncharacterized protein PGTG_10446 [Puccinia graminis f. sp. tritici CRL 75-36-700-3]EFP84068.2 hypothetical protein PGTG_10446 [Puccinia graminis f. sp. tritici CRL 75-36-700-3]